MPALAVSELVVHYERAVDRTAFRTPWCAIWWTALLAALLLGLFAEAPGSAEEVAAERTVWGLVAQEACLVIAALSLAMCVWRVLACQRELSHCRSADVVA